MLSLAHRYLPPVWLQAKRIVVFEDSVSVPSLFPMNVLRPSWEIRAGLGPLVDWLRGLRTAGYSVALRARGELQVRAREMAGFDDSWQPANEPVVFMNGRLLRLPAWNGELPSAVMDSAGQVLWAMLPGEAASKILPLSGTEIGHALVKQVGTGVHASQAGVLAAEYVWDYMACNDQLLTTGLAEEGDLLLESPRLTGLPAGVHLVGDSAVYCGAGTRLFPTVVLDTSDGPIWLGADVTIEPHCFLKGPLAIGEHGRLKAGTTLYTNSSFGPHCRVSGEISNSILQGYVNKQHAGFLGNSHIGSWVNFGADTTVSNLRNDYEPVRVKLGQKLVNSGRQFVGLLCGDHTRSGINTMFNTGTVVGVAANVYGGGYPTRFIRSFSWGGKDGFHTEPLARTPRVPSCGQ
ncbi:MAG: hypothetical protein IPG71_06215 [bacterium]|nr:hypothetical protein [bacterium]